MRFVRGFCRFWYDFIVGDDWKLAAVVVLAAGVGAALVAAGHSGPVLAALLGVGLAAAFTAALLLDVRLAQRRRR